jgi:hypothetical protein
MKLAIVTATTDPERAAACIQSWEDHAIGPFDLTIVVNGRGLDWDPEAAETTQLQARWIVVPSYLGTVPAFKVGTHARLDIQTDGPLPDVIACLHDDFQIDSPGWDEKVLRHFERYPNCGLAGFGGAVGLGDIDIYKKPYDPMQLARIGFRSNLDDAEKHGLRSMLAEQVACLDGFSQIGRREFFDGYRLYEGHAHRLVRYSADNRPWTVLEKLGFVHHFYDGALGCLAKRYGWQTWYIPVRGHHFGGRTAVGDQGYAAWAKTQTPEGDQGFWQAAHRIGYESFRNELPIRL